MNLRAVSCFAIALTYIGCAPTVAHAAVTLTAEDEVIVQSHEVIEDDLIVWSSYVRVDGVVKGDLVVFGEEVVIEGIVEQDLIAVGKTVYLNGQVNDDASIAAYAVALGESARVADDLFDLSYSLETKGGAKIGGTLHAASRLVLLAGPVVEDVLVRTGALELRGLTGGDVRAVVGGLEGVTHSEFVIDLALEVPDLDDGIRVASTAMIGGELDHRSVGPAVVESGARITGGVRHEDWQAGPTGPIQSTTPATEPFFGGETESATLRLTALLGVGLLLAVAVPGWLVRRGGDVRDRPADMLGWGVGAVLFGGLASIVIGVVFLILLTIGLAVGASGLAWTALSAATLLQMALFALFGIAVFYVAPVLASVGIGGAVLARLRPGDDRPSASVTDAMLFLAVGAVVVIVLRAIPWVGWLIGLGAALVGLGALAIWLRTLFLESGALSRESEALSERQNPENSREA